ncbi:response regulator [Proteobacteria bacterium 005FR1]|nr:response regulator [Proteobacteria bacterium 005FR1]
MTCDRILIVEDEPDIRETLKDILELEGFSVTTAANGREALQRVEEIQRPCLILLDLMMPVMDGWQFLHILKDERKHVFATIPVVVISAAADVSAVQQQYGCKAIKKPVSISTLVELAHEYCEPASAC